MKVIDRLNYLISIKYFDIPLINRLNPENHLLPKFFSEITIMIRPFFNVFINFTVPKLFVMSISIPLFSYNPGVSINNIFSLRIVHYELILETFAHRVTDIVLLLTLYFYLIFKSIG